MKMKNEYQKAVSRKADRLKTANVLVTEFETFAGAEITTEQNDKDREIRVMGSVGPYKFSIDLRALTALDCFMVHWYGKAQYPPEFIRFVNSINKYHHCKATGIHYTLDDMISKVSGGIRFLRKHLDNENSLPSDDGNSPHANRSG